MQASLWKAGPQILYVQTRARHNCNYASWIQCICFWFLLHRTCNAENNNTLQTFLLQLLWPIILSLFLFFALEKTYTHPIQKKKKTNIIKYTQRQFHLHFSVIFTISFSQIFMYYQNIFKKMHIWPSKNAIFNTFFWGP